MVIDNSVKVTKEESVMVCRVCKRELTEEVCSFCGEDNSPYMQSDVNEETAVHSEEPKTEIKKKKTKYKLNKRKLARLVVIVICIIAFVFCVAKIFGGDKKEENVQTPKNLFSSGMLAVSVNGEWGYINADNPSIFAVSPQFSHVTDYHNDLAAVCIDGKFSLINKDGELVCEPTFDAVGEFSDNGMIAVEKDGKWGYVDTKADFKIEPKFGTAYGFAPTKTAVVSVGGSFGFIGEDGEYVIAPQYDMALSFTADGFATVKTGGKWGYIDKDGNMVIEPVYDEAYGFESGLAVVKQYGSYGLIDTEGNVVIKPQFDERFYFEGDVAVVNVGHRYGVIDKSGNYVIKPAYRALGSFGSDGLAPAQRADGLCGYINASDEFVIDAQYEETLGFRLGLAPVKKGGKWGYIDKDGNMIIEPKYLKASEFFDEGFAVVYTDGGNINIINQEGNVAMVESATSIDNILR